MRRKGLLFVGQGHDETHFGLPPEKPYRRPMESRYRAPIGFDMYTSPFASVLMVVVLLLGVAARAQVKLLRILQTAVMESGYGRTTRCRRSSNCASVWPNASRKLAAGSSRSANSAK
jgi:hypothetical protein